MPIYLFRAGRNGEYKQKFLTENRVILTWDNLDIDLSKYKTRPALKAQLNEIYPDEKKGRIRNWLGQIFPMAQVMQVGDWIVLPSKRKAAVHIGEVTGAYQYDPAAPDPFKHSLPVKWLETDIPRTNFDQDLLYSFGAFMTVCQISRNDAEERIRAMATNNWKSTLHQPQRLPVTATDDDTADAPERETITDLEQFASDQIARFLIRKYKGHGMARLVDAILRAQGYVTYVPPEGPDGGVDIIAAPDPLGFGQPRIVVQVKTGDTPIDRPTLDQLKGTMSNFHADFGLLVSWSGFKQSVDRVTAQQFFKVRLWDQQEIIRQLLEHYTNLDDEIKVELPLKRVWVLGLEEE